MVQLSQRDVMATVLRLLVSCLPIRCITILLCDCTFSLREVMVSLACQGQMGPQGKGSKERRLLFALIPLICCLYCCTQLNIRSRGNEPSDDGSFVQGNQGPVGPVGPRGSPGVGLMGPKVSLKLRDQTRTGCLTQNHTHVKIIT